MQDVGDREIVAESGQHQRHGGDGDRSPARDAGAASGLAQPVVFAEQRQRPGNTRIDRQGEAE
jgi:hypothetical protein